MKTKLLLHYLQNLKWSIIRPATAGFIFILALSPEPFALSQIPQGFNYQAIARDGSGNPITGASMQVKIGILSDTIANTMVWEELFNPVKTNAYGMLTVIVGTGVKQSGSAATFNAIDWTKTPLFLRTSIYYPSSWKTMGTTKLQSVPYSMVAGNLDGTVPLLSVKGNTTTMDSALFVVRNNTGQIVFAVYNEGVRIYVDDGIAKGATKGGFAIGGFGTAKGTSQPYFVVDPDSIRAYIDNNPVKAVKGGFAIGGFDRSKGSNQNFLTVSDDSIRLYINDVPTKAVKGGFAIGGFDRSKGTQLKYMKVTDDSTRIFVNQSLAGTTGGFTVGGRTATGVTADPFTSLTPDNYLIGQRSGKGLTTGKYNSFLGYETGIANRSGSKNVFLGYHAGNKNDTASFNVFIGNDAGYSNNYGHYNAFLGYQSGYSNSTGSSNLFLGYQSGYNNQAGNFNSFVGYMSGYSNSTGISNSFLGSFSGANNNTGSNSTFVGYNAGYSNTTGDGNNFIGTNSGYSNTTGAYNVFLGPLTGYSNKSGLFNIFIGFMAGYSNTSNNNIFIGNEAGQANTTGDRNMGIGYCAGYNTTTGTENTFVGDNAGFSNVIGNFNTYLGAMAGTNSIGHQNTFIGTVSGYSNTTGNFNVYIGFQSARNNTTGVDNVFVGHNSGQYMAAGSQNVFIGSQAGRVNSGSGNVFIGYYAGNSETGSNKLYIDNGNTSYPFIYGDFSAGYLTFNEKVGINITPTHLIHLSGGAYSDGAIWTNASDRNLKENFENVDGGEILGMINQLPVTRWNYKTDSSCIKHIGPVAQDFYSLFGLGNDNKSISSIDPSGIALVAIKELSRQNRSMKEEIESTKQENRQLRSELDDLKALVNTLVVNQSGQGNK